MKHNKPKLRGAFFLTFFLCNILLLTPIFTLGSQAAPSPSPSATPAPVSNGHEITIFHTSDIHGKVEYNKEAGEMGLAYISGIKKSVKDSLLIDSGNYLSGSAIANLSRGADIIDLMNAAGYDYAGIGADDFAYGQARVPELSLKANFKILSTNISKDGKTFVKESDIKEVDGVKVGFFSIISPEIQNTALLKNVYELSVSNMYDVARRTVDALKKNGADVVVAITQLGNESDSTNRLASSVSGIDVIFDGNSNVALTEGDRTGKKVENTLIINPGGNGSNVAKVTLSLNKDKHLTALKATLINAAMADNFTPDPEVITKINEFTAEIKYLYEDQIAVSPVNLPVEKVPGVLTQSAPVGNFFAEIFREKADADIALISGGSIKSGILEGPITRAQLMEVFEYGAQLQTKIISPRILKTALESGINQVILDDDGQIDPMKSATTKFPQIAGFKFSYNPKSPVGEKIISIELDNGKKLNLNDARTKIKIAASNSLFGGSDEYHIFDAVPELDSEFGEVSNALIEYVQASGTVTLDDTIRASLTDKTLSNAFVFVIIFIVVISITIFLIIAAKLISLAGRRKIA